MPLPLSTAKKVAKPLCGIGRRVSKMFPDLKMKLEQTDMNIDQTSYTSIALFASIFWTLLILVSFPILSLMIELPSNFPIIMVGVSGIIGIVSFIYIIFYPGLILTKKIKKIEKNLLFALRHLLIQVKSGLPLFDGLVSVSNGDYGLISEEFRDCVKNISTGTSETDALEELALKNPSLYFRRTIWQLANAFRSGTDLSRTLENIVNNLVSEQKIAIRKYGSQLNPLAMMYMMIAVIIPSLGITFLIIFSSFSGIQISKSMFWIILAGIGFFQFTFIGIIKSKRPSVEL